MPEPKRRREAAAPERGARRRRGLARPALVLGGLFVLALLAVGTERIVSAILAQGTAGAGLGPVRLVPDDEGEISEWILGLCSEYEALLMPPQVEIIQKADPKIRFRVLYTVPSARTTFEAQLRACRLEPGDRITWQRVGDRVAVWTRDYFLMGEGRDGGPVFLTHHPDHYRILRCGGTEDCRSALTVARAVAGGRDVPTRARTEGGALVVTRDRVFVNDEALGQALRNRDFPDVASALAYLQGQWGLPVEVLSFDAPEPPHHCDLYLMPAGPGRLVVGSPSRALEVLAAATPREKDGFLEALGEAALRSPLADRNLNVLDIDVLGSLWVENADPHRLQAFERVLRRLEGLGYECHLVPLLLLDGHRSGAALTISYTNVIQDEREGERTVYLPTYGFPRLDESAAATWRALGYRVVRIDSLGPALLGGAVHCMSHVLRRPKRG